MKSFWTPFSFILCLLSLTACGERKSNGKKIISLNEERLERFVNELTFECESLKGDKCPEGIGRLIIYNRENPNESSLCSGFLVKDNILITNNHCVSSLKECEDTFINIYTEKEIVKARCESILYTEADNSSTKLKKIDVSVLKINRPVPIKFLDLNKEEILPGENLHSWVVDHISGKRARITELKCEFENHSPSMRLKNCPIILGNSGSPLLDERRNVVGVLWGSTVDETIGAEFPLESRRELTDYGFATAVSYFQEFFN